jgi:hypothetical protein
VLDLWVPWKFGMARWLRGELGGAGRAFEEAVAGRQATGGRHSDRRGELRWNSSGRS